MKGRLLEVAPGRRLHVEARGSGFPVLWLHGFTGRGSAFAGVAERLGPGWRHLFVDLLGHGASDAPADEAAYDMRTCVADLLRVLDAEIGGAAPAAHVVGYSMGGRVALALAAWHPERVRSLVTIGARAGFADPAVRSDRVAADRKLADRIECEGIAWFADHWGGLPLFASQQRLGPDFVATLREERLACDPRGLAGSLRALGAGAQPPLHAILAHTDVPALLAVGELDSGFHAVTTELGQTLRRARTLRIAGAGHAAHLEAPAALAAAIQQFLASQEPCMTTVDWKSAHDYDDIRYEEAEGLARITICRPEVRNAFRPRTLFELLDAFARARENPRVGVVLFTGEGDEAFCSGGDQRVRGDAGYVDDDGTPRLNVLDLQRLIRTMPKPVIALVAGYAIGGGHVLHLICDLTIAADNARFGQTGPRVGSFDGGFGASYLARVVGQKKAREIWYLCEQYGAEEAEKMGLVNKVVPLAELEQAGVAWGRRILEHSPIAIRCLKAAFNADTDGQAGIQELAGHATQLFYMTEEAQEGRDAFVQKRDPDFSRFPWRP